MAERDTTPTIEGEEAENFLQHGNGNFEATLEAMLAVNGLVPFLGAFAKKLGDAFGDSTVKVIGRLKPDSRRKTVLVEAELPEREKTTILFNAATSDEARLVLLDLDVTELRGKTLRWDAERNLWQPDDSAGAEQ